MLEKKAQFEEDSWIPERWVRTVRSRKRLSGELQESLALRETIQAANACDSRCPRLGMENGRVAGDP